MSFDREGVRKWNESITAEFRANHGKVGGHFEGVPMLLMTTKGAKSGRPHLSPLVYQPDGDRMIIFASRAGDDHHPHWYLNLVAHPEVTLEVGDETFTARATVLAGDERARFFARQKAAMPQFAEYEAKTSRLIPVVALERVAARG